MSENSRTSLTLDPDRALFEGHVQGLVVTLYQNERPPCGLSGVMDWYFHGAISRCIQKGAMSGKVGECTYFPLTRNGTIFHLILAGAGQCSTPGQRTQVPSDTLQILHQNLLSLKIPKMGISRADFGQVQTDYFGKYFKGVSLWITP